MYYNEIIYLKFLYRMREEINYQKTFDWQWSRSNY